MYTSNMSARGKHTVGQNVRTSFVSSSGRSLITRPPECSSSFVPAGLRGEVAPALAVAREKHEGRPGSKFNVVYDVSAA